MPGRFSRFRRLLRGLAYALVAMAAALTSGCATPNPATGGSDFTPFMSPEKEKLIGAEEHPKMLAAFGGVYDDPEIGGYVASIGGRLAAHSERADLAFRFTVLNSPVVNAFALPGGYVYVSRGLLALANSEAELASVLAHEIGHVTGRHSAQRYNTSVFLGLGSALFGAVVGNDLANQLANMGAAAYLRGHSREQEHQADELGIRYMAATGYDAGAAVSFLRTLAADDALSRKIAGAKGEEPLAGIFATHPRTAERVARTAAATQGQVKAPRLRSRYVEKIDGLLYGDDPRHGLIRGRTFFHPDLGFTFDAPPGFRLQNSAKAVLAIDQDEARMRFDSEPGQWSGGMLDYLNRKWGKGLRLEGLNRIDIDGMEAATASARVSSRRRRVDLRLVAIRFDRRTIYRFLFITPGRKTEALDEDFRRTAFGFRRLGDDERDAIKPLRIRFLEVKAGDTVATLAAQMQNTRDRPADIMQDKFRVLNGLASGDTLTPGRLVKIATE
jgi:predicted Zn-dependent protease